MALALLALLIYLAHSMVKSIGNYEKLLEVHRYRFLPILHYCEVNANEAKWTTGSLKNIWKPRMDELITLFTEKMSEFAERRQEVVLSDKAA